MLSIIIPVLHIKRPLNKKRFFMPRQTIKETLISLNKSLRIKCEIIIVCNGQDKELVEFVKTNNFITRFCLVSENVGVSRAWNIGANLSSGNVLCFLNDDVSIGKLALDKLYDYLIKNEKIGQVGPEGSYWKNCAHVELIDCRKPTIADVISGFCFLIKADLYYKLGGFDTNFSPAGYEEIDMSYRIRQAGYDCIVYPDRTIKHFHHHSVSSQNTDISFMGKTINTVDLHKINTKKFKIKWQKREPISNKNN